MRRGVPHAKVKILNAFWAWYQNTLALRFVRINIAPHAFRHIITGWGVGSEIYPPVLRDGRFAHRSIGPSWRLVELPFRSGAGRQFRAYSYRMGKEETPLAHLRP